MGEPHDNETATATAKGEADVDETMLLPPAEQTTNKDPIAYSEADTELGDFSFQGGPSRKERITSGLSRALPFVAVAAISAAVAVVIVVVFVMRPSARPVPAPSSAPTSATAPAAIAPPPAPPGTSSVTAAPAPKSVSPQSTTVEASSTGPHLLADSASPGTLSGGLPNDIYDEFGVCNYLTTHTEQASGGIESLALLGEQQGMGPSKSQGVIQQAVTNVCPWNAATFAKHVMTDTSNF